LDKRDLIVDTIDKCLNNNIAFKLINQKTHMGCGGWVSDRDFTVCTKSDRFLEIFVHEASHLDQLLDKKSIWYHPHLKDGDDEFDIWNSLLRKRHPIKCKRAWKKTCELEIDCDKRAIKKIKKYNLSITLDKYIQEANCYHASYYYFYKYACFYSPNHIPYEEEWLNDMFPSDKILDIHDVWVENKKLGEYIKRYGKKL
jgi:hypothetical protein